MLPKPTDGELAILRILWQNGPSTVRTVNDALNLEREVGYTTTLKLMQIMYEKGLLDREKSGKTHIYQALIEEEEAQMQLLDKLMDSAFHGSAKNLIMRALGNRRSSQEELDEIRQYLDEISKENNK